MLENLLGIKNSLELARVEERISKQKALALYDSGRLWALPAGKFSSLAEIHKELFGSIYAFAGHLRTDNIAKGSFRFASVLYLPEALSHIERMSQRTYDQIVEKYVEMNVAHPFREGNGRAGRLWLDGMFQAELGMAVDWARIDKEQYLFAMERSPVRDTEIKTLLRSALVSAKDYNRTVFMKGLDQSYRYENLDSVSVQELDRSESNVQEIDNAEMETDEEER